MRLWVRSMKKSDEKETTTLHWKLPPALPNSSYVIVGLFLPGKKNILPFHFKLRDKTCTCGANLLRIDCTVQLDVRQKIFSTWTCRALMTNNSEPFLPKVPFTLTRICDMSTNVSERKRSPTIVKNVFSEDIKIYQLDDVTFFWQFCARVANSMVQCFIRRRGSQGHKVLPSQHESFMIHLPAVRVLLSFMHSFTPV